MGVVQGRSANSYDHVCASATTVSRAEQRALASDRKFQALVINGIAQEVRGWIQLAKIELGTLQFLLHCGQHNISFPLISGCGPTRGGIGDGGDQCEDRISAQTFHFREQLSPPRNTKVSSREWLAGIVNLGECRAITYSLVK